MRITIIYDNTSVNDKIIADWGFSCLVETGEKRILFDTGGNGEILMKNMKTLGIDPLSIEDVVISHPDFDHIGGLSHFLNSNNTAILHNPVSFRGVKYSNVVKFYSKPTEIYPGIFLTGELDSREQSLAVKTKDGLVLIVGCGHPGISKIMRTIEIFGSVYAIVGGLHGFDDYNELCDLKKICPTHCTVHKAEIKSLFPKQYLEGGAGKQIEL
ncbi:MAG: MBL fold metallo-hydrolase [Candidatus Cloacimonetes bacterium]|nr:MBL fold metallo-hydrolase [Candidatus Cloacimonadota bacterium]